MQADASQGLDAALDQIEGMRGSADVPVRLKAINPQGVPQEGDNATIEARWQECQKGAELGYNIYVFPQPIEGAGNYANGKHVTHIEFMSADGDNAPLATEFHVEPSFVLFNRETGRWWLSGGLMDLTKRLRPRSGLIAEDDSDVRVNDLGRVGRLPGCARWKNRRRYGEYEYIHGNGETAWPGACELPQVAARQGKKDEGQEQRCRARRKARSAAKRMAHHARPATQHREAIKYAATCDVGTKLVDGDDTLYKTAGMMKDFGLSRAKAMEVLKAEYLPRCLRSPWHPLTSSGHRASASKSTLNEPGCKTPEYETGGLFGPRTPRLATVDGEAVDPAAAANGELVKPEWLFNGPEYAERPKAKWIIEGVSGEKNIEVASGRSQAGKTLCEIAKGLSECMGVPWLGLPVSLPGRCSTSLPRVKT